MDGTFPSLEVRFTGKVRSIQDGIALIAYEGNIEYLRKAKREGQFTWGKASLTGLAQYDLKARQMRALTMVFDGFHRYFRPQDEERSIGGVVEWRSR